MKGLSLRKGISISVITPAGARGAAKSNAERHGVADRIEFRQSDLLEQVTEKLDIIVSNPPYVSQSEYEALPVDVKDFEPKIALLAGTSGTVVIERLIAQSADRLPSGGQLLMEVSPMIAEAVAKLLVDWSDVQIPLDSAGRQRIVCARKE